MGVGREWSGAELLPARALAAEQPERRSQGSVRGGALWFKGGGGDEEATAPSVCLLVCVDR